MKVEELNFGNWVFYKNRELKQVKGTSKGKVCIEINGKEKWVRVDTLSPIPLSIELVQEITPNSYKNHFKLQTYGVDKGKIVYHTYTSIEYVHQFQNFCYLNNNWNEILEITEEIIKKLYK